MKKPLFFSLTLLLTVIASCSHDDDVMIVGADYYPLQVGNYWRYQSFASASDTFHLENTVVGTVTLDDKSYYEVLSYSDFYGRSDTSTYYYRIDENAYVFGRSENPDDADKEEQIYHLNASKGEHWRRYESSAGMMKFSDLISVTLNQTVTIDNCRLYSFDDPDFVDEEWGTSLAPGIGVVETTSNWGYTKIVEAKINGVSMVFQ